MKKHQVFVSSTYEDLIEERQAVIQALLELDCIPSGMELFPAADDDQWTLIKKVIDDCDYYIVIISGRYGSIAASGKSYTQMEYEYAVSQGKPVVAFLHRNPGMIVAKKTEETEKGKRKLKQFRQLVQQKMCNYWTSASDLNAVVSRDLPKLIMRNPAIGWVPGNRIASELDIGEKALRSIVICLRHRLNARGLFEKAFSSGSTVYNLSIMSSHSIRTLNSLLKLPEVRKTKINILTWVPPDKNTIEAFRQHINENPTDKLQTVKQVYAAAEQWRKLAQKFNNLKVGKYTSSPTMQGILVDKQWIVVELIPYDTSTDDRPALLLTPKDNPELFSLFSAKFKKLWQCRKQL